MPFAALPFYRHWQAGIGNSIQKIEFISLGNPIF
jgi:hypothetical protein